jgi:sterol desaturase/sphingolipid hydroxylase (fatty acid hydroxylase superfamily)
MCGHGKGRF